MLDVFRDAEVVVSASGSCEAMLKVFHPELFTEHPRAEEAQALGGRSGSFLIFSEEAGCGGCGGALRGLSHVS